MKHKRSLNLFKWPNLLLVVVTLFSYLSPLLHPSQFWPASFLGLSYPWLLLLNILFIFFWALKKHYYFLFSTACILIGWGHFSSFVGLSFHGEVPPDEEDLVVMTFNCYSLRDRHHDKKLLTKEAFEAFISRHDPDILFLQEFIHRSSPKSYIDHLTKNTNLKHFFGKKSGPLAILSRYPLENEKIEYFENRSNGFQYADLNYGDQTFRVFNIHLQTNAVSGIADKVASEGDIKEKETWLNIKGMMGRYRRSARYRASQAESVKQVIAKSPYPVIIGGDFNDTPMSYTYHHLSQNLTDTFKEKGRGLGTTYAGSIPALRIDYILTSSSFRTLEHQIIRKSFSDHYPVISRISISNID